MSPKTKPDSFVSYKFADALFASQSLIAASSMMDAISTEYAHTGIVALGALQHASSVLDQVIERLRLAELEVEQTYLPF